MAIAHNLVFGNVSARDYGIFISGEGAYDAPVRNVEFVTVPGRNGAIPIDKGSYDNITIEYPAFTFALTQTEFRKKLTDFKNAIMSQIGYQRLVDTYHPDEYRMAIYCEGLEVDPIYYSRAGSFTLKFTCKPQRYLTSGENEIEVNNGDVVNNPTLFDASPLLMIDGYGTVSFNGYEIETQNRNVNTVTLWENTVSEFNDIDVYGQDEYSATYSMSQTFNKTMFNNGDTFSFKATVKAFEGYYPNDADMVVTKTDSNSTVSAETNSSGNAVISKNCTFTVGTSSTLTNTVTLKTYDGGVLANTSVDAISIAYDGNDKVTITLSRTTNDSNLIAWGSDIIMYKATGVSSVSLHDYTYVDCELGEAYKYNDGQIISLNAYVDLGSDLPKLASGNNTFAIDNTITSLVLVPRWWKL